MSDKLYAILSDNLNDPYSLQYIKFQETPGRTNMSSQEKIEGWLGTTNNIHREALGEFDEDSARTLLVENGVQINVDVPIRVDVNYALGGSERAESYNHDLAYSYHGPWYNVPEREQRWCIGPHEVRESRIVLDQYEDAYYDVIVTPDEKSTLGMRAWYIIERGLELQRAQAIAETSVGRIFDAARLTLY